MQPLTENTNEKNIAEPENQHAPHFVSRASCLMLVRLPCVWTRMHRRYRTSAGAASTVFRRVVATIRQSPIKRVQSSHWPRVESALSSAKNLVRVRELEHGPITYPAWLTNLVLGSNFFCLVDGRNQSTVLCTTSSRNQPGQAVERSICIALGNGSMHICC